MKSWICIFVFLFSACASSPFNGPNPFEHTELLLDAEETIGGLIHASQIPQKLLGHTKTIVMFLNLVKTAMIAWARVGKGVVIVRSPKTGKWSNKGLKQLFKTQYDLGKGPQIALGPVGKTIDLNLALSKNDIFAYSRIEGLFAGLSFEGTVIWSDRNANYEYYQQSVSNRNLLMGHEGIKVPASGRAFLQRMNKLAGQRNAGPNKQ